MKYKQRISMVILSAAALFLHGCSCSSSSSKIDSGTPTPPTPTPPATFELSGVASKGIIMNARVRAFPIQDGSIGSTPAASGITNDNGGYTLTMPEARRDAPMLVRIEAIGNDETMMRCDLADGCAEGVEFGESLLIQGDENFVLESVIAEARPDQTVNVTLLTHIAAQQAKASGLPNGNTALRDAIAEANSKVANRFGITGRLTSAPVIDLTDATAVNAALASNNSQALHMAALNAAIAQARRVKNPGASIADAASGFTSDYVQDNGLAGNTTSTTMPGYSEVLTAAQGVLAQVQNLTPDTPINLSELLAELNAEAQLAANEPPDNPNPGTPSSTANQPALDKVKAMVGDLRDLSLSIGGAELEGEVTLRSAAEEFELQLQAAEMANSDDMSHLIAALEQAAEAVEAADRAYRDDGALESYEHEGITVTIEVSNQIPSFSIDQAIEVTDDAEIIEIDVNIVASWHLDSEETEGENFESASGSGTASLTGTATSEHLHLILNQDSTVTMAMDIHHSQDALGAEVRETSVDLSALQMVLHVTLSQRESESVSHPVSIEGRIELDVGQFAGEEMETNAGSSFTAAPTTLSLKLSGAIASDSLGGAEYKFAFAAQGDAQGITYQDEGLNENDSEYVQFVSSLFFNATLAGIPDVVVVSYHAVRTGLDTGQNTLTLRYFPGKLLRLRVPVVDGDLSRTITVTNQDGVVLTLTETFDENDRSILVGDIALDGESYATVEENASGIIWIRYSDESFESI